ncbi:MAG: hypothetical protein LBJ39_00420 [Tannerellaceae bacterium]|jgi:hypothetical protein|nr:hypothetical protein [Tannerellaceae bacterium]
MKTLNFYVLVLISCICVDNAFSQNLFADHTDGLRKKEEAPREADVKPAYEWQFFSSTPASFDESVMQYAGDDYFGQKVACLKTLVEKYYVYKEEIVPGDPNMRTIIRKPDIYNTARKVDKYLRKEVKKGNITLQQATTDLVHVLEVAIAAVDEYDTAGFESSINNLKDNVDRQIAVFKQVKLTKYN